MRLELSILATDGNLDPKEWELLKGYATTLGMQTEYNEYYAKAAETKAVKAIQEGFTLSTDEKAIIQKCVNIQELISSQVKLMVDNTFFADKNWTTLWPQEWKAKWDNVKQLASDFGAVDAFNAGLTSVMPSILSCLDAESIIQKWQVAKEFAGIGDASAQAALKQAVEEWLRKEVEKLSGKDTEKKNPSNWKIFLEVAHTFDLDYTDLKKEIEKAKGVWEKERKGYKVIIKKLECLRDGILYEDKKPRLFLPGGKELKPEDKEGIANQIQQMEFGIENAEYWIGLFDELLE